MLLTLVIDVAGGAGDACLARRVVHVVVIRVVELAGEERHRDHGSPAHQRAAWVEPSRSSGDLAASRGR